MPVIYEEKDPKRIEGWAGHIRRERGPNASYGVVYFVGPASGPIKIGFTRDFSSRMAKLQSMCPFPLVVWAAIEGTTLCEADLHKAHAEDRLHGEWFSLTPAIAHLIKSRRELTGLRELQSYAEPIRKAIRLLTTPERMRKVA